MTIQSRRCGLERRERQARDKVSDAKKIQKTAPEHRWGGRTIFAKIVREGKAMIHSSRRDRKAKAIAEVLAMIANAQAPLAPIGRVPSSRRTNGYSKPPPNFARL